MKKQLVAFLICSFVSAAFSTIKAQTSFNPNTYSGWISTPGNYFATLPAAPGVTFNQPARGAGNQFSTATDGINSGQWQNTSAADAITANRYFTFSATANNTTQFQIDSLLLVLGRSGTGPDSCMLQYKSPATGYNYVPVTSTVHTILNPSTNPTTSLMIIPSTAIQVSPSDSVVFRLVAWHASSSLGKMRIINNTAFYGNSSPGVPYTISAATVQTGDPICVSSLRGDSIQVTFNAVGTFNPGNTYSLELSDASGSFASPLTIGSVNSQANSGTINGLIPAGTSGAAYHVRIKSSSPVVNGLDTTTVVVHPGMELNAAITQPDCPGGVGAIDLTLTGGTGTINYTWSNGSTAQAVINLPSGPCGVGITDAAGCSVDTTFQIISIPNFNVSQTHTNASCHSGNNGEITVNVSGATAPYTISWTGNGISQSGLTASNLTAGTYHVHVLDANNCVYTNQYTITQPTAVNISAVITHAACASCNGNIALSVSGGVNPYTFDWSNNATTSQILGMPGTYCVEVTDANNCMTDSCFVISSTAGISEADASSSFAAVFPNPASEAVQFAFSGNLKGIEKMVVVTDLFGKIIWQEVISPEMDQIEVPVDRWAGGTYVYQLLVAGKSFESGRIQVIH